MSPGGRHRTGWFRAWWRDVSVQIAGSIAASLVVALLALAVALIEPARTWFCGPVYLYGWGLILLVLASAAVGFFLARWRLVPPENRSEKSSFAITSREVESFQPDELGTKIIKLLRFGDGRWIKATELIDVLEVDSRQDLHLSLRQLSGEGLVAEHDDNYILSEESRSYRLAPDGVALARSKGFLTMTEHARLLNSGKKEGEPGTR